MKYITSIILAASISACGTDNDVNVNGGTRNELVVRYEVPICEDPIFNTAAAKQACIEAVTSQTIDVETLSQEQIDIITGVNNGAIN